MAALKKPKEIKEPFGFVGGQLLEDILKKLPDAITEEERDILRARRSYLTEQQIKDYGLDEKPKKEEEGIGSGAETVAREKELKKMSDKELKEIAKGLEIDAKKMNKKELIAAIIETETKPE